VVAAAAQPTNVFLAGSFNDWNPTNTLWQMTPLSNGLFRAGAFFQQGAYPFKFVVDGDWRGEGAGGALVSGGRDIRLTIPRHGVFIIQLDTQQRRWQIRPGLIRRPYAVLQVRGEPRAGAPILLDGSESVPRTGQTIASFAFGQNSNDAVQVSLPAAADGRCRVVLPREGTYRFWLRVDDGTASEPVEVAVRARRSYQVVGDWTASDPADPATWLTEVSPGVYEKWLRSDAPAERQLLLLRNHDAGHLLHFLTVAITQTNAQHWRVRYDEAEDQFTCTAETLTEFVFDPSDYVLLEDRGVAIESVHLAGSFNHWSATALPMQRQPDGRFVAALKLDEGPHYYKFVVNGDIWLQDLRADPALAVDDGHQGRNSGIYVGEQGRDFGQPKPNAIERRAVRTKFNRVSTELAEITVRTLQNDVPRVELRLADGAPLSLRHDRAAFGFDWWRGEVFTGPGPVEYRIVLTDGAASETIGPLTADGAIAFPTPDWAKHVVWYQIFPDRFANGAVENDPPRTLPWKWDWYQFAPWERPNETRTFSGDWYNRWFGGDLQGVMRRLPYFRELGVTALYFCPLFEASAYHGYDTTDYRHIAQTFGHREPAPAETLDPATWQWTKSDKLFLEFLQKARAQGLKVVVDGVFNHMGKFSFALQDVLTNGQNSIYADWFDIEDWGPPVRYKSWDGGGWMPNFRKNHKHGIASASAREYLFHITRRWMDPNGDGDPSDGVDGWRLDVAPDVPDAFWIEWRKLVKSINPNAYIVGEHWGEPVRHLQGNQWDATMNYAFATRAIRYFIDRERKITASEFDRQLRQLLGLYPLQVNFVMQNLYDSHDTDRLVSMVINPDRNYDADNRPQDGHRYDGSKPGPVAYRIANLMATFQMTFLGAPMIWYGNEVGMYGADDPTNRKPMLWSDLGPYTSTRDFVMPEVFEHYQRIIAIRNTYPALRTGLYRSLYTDDANDIFAFSRVHRADTIVVVFNTSDRSQTVELPVPFPAGSRVVDVLSASPVSFVHTPMAQAGFPDFAPGATVRTIRVSPAASPHYVVREGKLTLALEKKSAAILARF
jgi:glycosidase